MYRRHIFLVALAQICVHLICAKVPTEIYYVDQLESDIYFSVPSIKANVSVFLTKPFVSISNERFTNWLHSIDFDSWRFMTIYSKSASVAVDTWCDLLASIGQIFYNIDESSIGKICQTSLIDTNNINVNITLEERPVIINIKQDPNSILTSNVVTIKTKIDFNNQNRLILAKNLLGSVQMQWDFAIAKSPLVYLCNAKKLPPFDIKINACNLGDGISFNYSHPALDSYITYHQELAFLYSFQKPVGEISFISRKPIKNVAIIGLPFNIVHSTIIEYGQPVVGAEIKGKMIFSVPLQSEKRFYVIESAINNFMGDNKLWQAVGELPYNQCDLFRFVKKNLVKLNGNSTVYCEPKTKIKRLKRDPNDDVLFSTDDYIQMARFTQSTVRVTSPIWNIDNPVREYGEELVGPNLYLPTYIIADIRRGHIGRPRPRIPDYIEDHLHNNMQFQTVEDWPDNPDQMGHLLAHSLGGSTTETYNFVPMTRLLNTGMGSQDPQLRSLWRNFERRIRSFLNDEHRLGRVEWRIFVIYDRQHPITYNRPISFSMHFSEYNHHTDTQASFDSDDITFSNQNSDPICEYAMNPHMSQFC